MQHLPQKWKNIKMSKSLTISGWAQHPMLISQNLTEISDYYNYITHKNINYNELSSHYDLIIGWSQGGHIALKIAQRLHIPKIVLIASPYEYLHESHGITRSLHQQIVNNFKNNPRLFLENFKNYICAGDKYFRKVITQINNYDYKTENLLYWLKKLPEIPKLELKGNQEIMYIYGQRDQVVSSMSRKKFATSFKNVRLELFKESSHVPFLSDNIKFNKLIHDFRTS